MDTKLIFVYNADSGIISALRDLVHKLVSPKTYPCSLCALTYRGIGMRGEWKTFVSTLGRPAEFLHADELKARYGVDAVLLPAVFVCKTGGLEVLIHKDALDACRTLDDLEYVVTSSMSNL